MTLNKKSTSALSDKAAFRGRFKSLSTLAFFIVNVGLCYSSASVAQDVKSEQSKQRRHPSESGWALKPKQELVASVATANVMKVSNLESASTENATEQQPIDTQGAFKKQISGNTPESEIGQNPIVYDITQGAQPITPPSISVRPVMALTDEQRQLLASQFEQIQQLKETEDAFSEQLGESYLSYGRMLMRTGRADEARKMLVNALHIAKINNGVNAIEQRPILRELFEMNLALGNADDTEANLQRIIWLEKKMPDNKDSYSYDLVVRLGNFYLDQYLNEPNVSELSLDRLNKSTKYLGYVINRYGDLPLTEVLLPYGELALAHHLKSRIQREVDRSYYQDTRQRSFADLNRINERSGARLNSFSRSEGYLKRYLKKAKDERDLVNTIRALLALGDLNLLSNRNYEAQKYYDLAWTGAQNLPLSHPIVKSFDNPVKLPSFGFSVVRKPRIDASEGFEFIPINLNIDEVGKVKKIDRAAIPGVNNSKAIRAKRLAKRVRFRPAIENGKLVAVDNHTHEVKITVSRAKLRKEPEQNAAGKS